MTARKRKKSVRYRGSKTHGCGSMKKRRGSGNKGGKGNAGSGKRADSKKPSYQTIKDYYGKHGFVSRSKKVVVPVNLEYFELHKESLPKQDGYYVVDLKSLGYTKLLGKGSLTGKFKFTHVEQIAKKAKEKLDKEGSVVELLS
ncbi:uL15 family ribosomal protein [Candidatus Woesearchaeota archaeon]|nr:uL15 family ribosomal protein [Candidatus Woesearchaeota archaeon]